MKTATKNDPCLDCGKPTLGVLELDNGTTIGVGINRLPYDDGERDGYLCEVCAGYECEKCGKNILLDEDITIVNEQGWNEKYHYECLTPEQLEWAKANEEVI